jgi:hypothetical protein
MTKNLILKIFPVFTMIILSLTAGISFANAQDVQSIENMSPAAIAALAVPFIIFVVVGAIIGIAFYVYSSLAYMAIAKKLNVENPWLAWVPVANIYLMAKMADMPTWPIFLLIGFVIPVLNVFFALALGVFSIIWIWKIFEKVGRPGWWVLISLIPFVGAVIFLVLLGIAAWGKQENMQQTITPPFLPPSNTSPPPATV